MIDHDLLTYYRARAAEYEQTCYRDRPERRDELDAEGLYLRGLVRGKEVLDLACGTGYWTRVLADTAAFIAAVDLSVEMIRQARRKEYGTLVSFVLGDLYRLPIARSAFDVVTLGFWFSHEPRQNYSWFLSRLRDLCRPGGHVWMIDNNLPRESSGQETARTDGHGNTYTRRRLLSGAEHIILKNYFTEGRLRETLGQRFVIERLVYGCYYWSAVLTLPS